MKKVREKWLINGRREKEGQEYYHKRKKAHKIIGNKIINIYLVIVTQFK